VTTAVQLGFSDESVALQCRRLHGVERLGRASRFEITAYADEPVESARVLGQKCNMYLEAVASARNVQGTVTRFAAVATAQEEKGRQYKLVVESSTVWQRYRRLSRVFQHLSIPDILTQVLEGSGWDPTKITWALNKSHEPYEYITQYAETDEHFVRRLCEREGLYFFFDVTDDGEIITFSDDASQIAKEDPAIVLVDNSALNTAGEFLWDASYVRRRRPGRVQLRDYDPKNPSLELKGDAELGQDPEKEIEVYEAPGFFKTESAGTAAAEARLKQLRGDSARLRFTSNAVRVRPGLKFEIKADADVEGSVVAFEGEYTAYAVSHSFDAADERYLIHVDAVPALHPVVLMKETRDPKIYGLHSAIVTGAAGEEIHPDADGNIFVHFHWDREGPTDETSSLPIRVAQPNTPGSMIIPRIGWEVFVAFEDGDPDRPYVLGKGYNAGHMPPFDLPENKMVSALRTFSSPGGGAMNSIHMDDGAGRQLLSINAGYDKNLTVANNWFTQTANAETKTIHGSQSHTVGANEDITVKQLLTVTAASQSASVGGKQEILVKGNFDVKVDTEDVMVGAALLEKVGNPVQGLINLGSAAAMAGVSALGGAALGGLGGKLSSALGGGLGGGIASHLLNQAGGALISSAASSFAVAPATNWALGQAGLPAQPVPPFSPLSALGDSLAGAVGAGPLVAAISGMSNKMPWEEPEAAAGERSGGGGTAVASDNSAAGGPGPGHRNEQCKGTYTEVIGGAMSVTTPGSITWDTSGASAITVGGSNAVRAKSYGEDVKGASNENDGSYHVKTSESFARSSLATFDTKIDGALSAKASGKYVVESKASMRVKIGGALKLKGAHVTFKVGSSTVSSSPGGIEIKASNIEIKGKTTQSGKSTH
jgi:type VI secretion system secreted protein VgrG